MMNPSSFDRIVSYFHALARQPFEFSGKQFVPYKKFVISDKVFRSYSCPQGCGACCMRCSLVWDEPNEFAKTTEEFTVNGITQIFYADLQKTGDKYCSYLNREDGRCGVYLKRPLPCRFELFKFVHHKVQSTSRAMVRLPGRAWNLTQINGTKGAMCAITPYDEALTKTHIRDLIIIKKWMDAFNIENDCQAVIDWISSGPKEESLVINRE